MALTPFQRSVCRLIADQRIASGESYEGSPPDAGDLPRRWRAMLDVAAEIVGALPNEESGKCVLDLSGRLFTGNAAALAGALASRSIAFHAGSIRGALPRIVAVAEEP